MNWKEKVLQTIRKAKDKVVDLDLTRKRLPITKLAIREGSK